jgi:hypothetical protein
MNSDIAAGSCTRSSSRDPIRFVTRLARAVCCALSLVASDVAADAGAAERRSAPAPVAQAQAEPGGSDRKRVQSWYAATVAEDEKRSFLMVHFWSKGPLFRSDAIIAGRRIVTIVDRTSYYILDSASGTGVAIERSAAAVAQDEDRGRPFGNELRKLLIEGGELVDTEESPHGPLDVYRVTDERGRRTLWMSTQQPPLPLRIQTYDRATATTGRVDYVNWRQGMRIWDEFFAPDPRIELERISYAQYKQRAGRRPIGPAPVLYRQLLHGSD